ncbi:MAG: TIGR03086 family metal-binding protein [Actinomycetota bacterium]|nr:TIGR03086 family metal-binding protein [Actinomycetota bacterium]
MSIPSTPADEHRELTARFTRLVEAVPDDAWSSPSPVDDWRARDVVRHLVEWFPGFLSAFAGVDLKPGPSVDEDPVRAWRALDDQVQALLDDPASAQRTLAIPHADPMPLPVGVVRFFSGDVFMHAWDLAMATGQDATLDPARCAEMVAGMEPIEELMRSSGQFGPRVEVPADADPQTRLLGFIGRDPAWEAPAVS